MAAFNVITLEHAEAIVTGAENAGQAVILQISQNAVAFHHGKLGPVTAAVAAVAASAAVPVGLHLDHVTSEALLHRAPAHGYTSVMYDASDKPHTANVAATLVAARFAHEHGMWIEAELGTVAGKDGAPPLPAHAPGARTDPDEAAAYVAATGVDALAVAVGSSHAMTDRTAILDHQLITALHHAVSVPLVLHGSSGVPDQQLRQAVAAGMVKVNIGTALNISYTQAIRDFLAGDASRVQPTVDPRTYLTRARDAVASTVAHFAALLASPHHTAPMIGTPSATASTIAPQNGPVPA
ncbi:class II fructose-bisphosphate aldolase [Micromonospora sp. SL4-19]|uniref:class II fructose-bisphosphate aldolase n=1 Tax=Micromonospora sp. SL4-19 TaxID=3399129 RepID=UPI003A4D692F